MLKLDIREVHYEMGESSTACCPIALAITEKFLGTHPTATSIWKKNGIPLFRGEVVKVFTEYSRFWHPIKNKIYEFNHDEKIQKFIIEFDDWYESSADMKTLPLEETTINFPKPTCVWKSELGLHQPQFL